jgi:tetratricopeptide (TPR) repeat protein
VTAETVTAENRTATAGKAPRFALALWCALSLGTLGSLTPPAAHGAVKPAKQAEDQLEFGVAMARRGLWSEALFRFRQANQLDPNNPRILNNLAVAHEAVGQFDEALAAYRRALELAPGDKEARRNFSRFIEFYQGYKPEGEGDAPADDGGEEAGAKEPPPEEGGV